METRRAGPTLPPVRKDAPTTTSQTPNSPAGPTIAPATKAPPTTPPRTVPERLAERFAKDGTTSKQEAESLPTSSGGPIKGGVLGFLLTQKAAPVLATGAEILDGVKGNPSLRALLQLRVECPPQYAPHVEVTRQDGSVIAGSVKGVDDKGRVVVDAGRGRTHLLPADEQLQAVRHQMDTDGDLHTALVSVFDAKTSVSDPWSLQGFAGKTLHIETFDREHGSLAVAAKKGDVSGRSYDVAGSNAEGLTLKGGGTLLKEFWDIAKVTVEQKAYSYKSDGMHLGDVEKALARGTAVEVVVAGKPTIQGTFLGCARDADGSDYVVVQTKNGVRHALNDGVVDVKAAATSRELWRHPDYGSVYGA